MTTVPAEGSEPQQLSIPDIAGMSLAEAAVAYAQAGWFIAPTDPTDCRNPGSYLGIGWPAKTTNLPAKVAKFWSKNPDAGIALHLGRSRAIAADLDVDIVPEDMSALHLGITQLSRLGGSQRGHRVFATQRTFINGKLRDESGRPVGEVRSGNAVIIASPTPHTKGGLYTWQSFGVVPALTKDARKHFLPAPEPSSNDVEAFFAAYSGSEGQNLAYCLPMAISRFQRLVESGEKNRHDAMFDALCIVLKEAHAQAYAAKAGADQLLAVWRELGIETEPGHDRGEWRRMLSAAVAVANGDDPIDRRKIMARDFGTDTRTPETDSSDDVDDPFAPESIATIVDEYNPMSDPWYAEMRLRRLRTRYIDEQLKREALEAAWQPIPDQGDLATQLANMEPDEPQIVSGLLIEGIAQINAQYKAGKTTLVTNLIGALASGERFLNRFDISKDFSGNIAHWNLEVSRNVLLGWYGRHDLTPQARRRILPLSVRGNLSLDFNNPLAVEWTIKWLQNNNIKAWIIDPLSKLFRDDENNNAEFNAWWFKLEHIFAEAGLRLIVIVHHTGHNGQRARGASAMMGNPDVLLNYSHPGDFGEIPSTSIRHLEAFGRGIELPPVEIDFDPAANALYATGSGRTRNEARSEEKAQKVGLAVWASEDTLNAGQLYKSLGWNNSGKNSTGNAAAVAHAEELGYIQRQKKGTATVHLRGSVDPRKIGE